MLNININLFKGNDEEEWRPIKGFPDYQVSNFGRVKSLKFGREKILKVGKRKDGYLIVVLYKEGRAYPKTVHKLVLETFSEKPESKSECNHKNGKKTDNRLENLEWVTHAENISHAIETGLKNDKGENNPNAKLSKEEVLKIFEESNAGVRTSELAAKYNVSEPTISNIKAGRIWKHLTNPSPEKPRLKNPIQFIPITINLNIKTAGEAI